MRIYEYLVRLKDQASNKLQRISRLSGQAENKVSFLTRAFSGLGAVVARLAITATLLLAARSVATLGIEMEQTRISFETFLGSAERGNRIIAQLNEFANVTPFDNAQVLRSAKSLLAYNVEAEKLLPTLRMLGDISAGVGREKLPNLILAFGQVKAASRLTGMELRQFTETGVPVLELLSKVTGKTVSVIKEELIPQGKIGFDVLAKALSLSTEKGGKFFNLMEKQSKSAGGLISTFWGKIRLVGANIGEEFNPLISKIFRKLGNLIDSNRDNIIAWGKGAAASLKGFINSLMSLWHWMQENKTTLQTLGLVAGVVFSAYLGYQSVLLAMAIKLKLVAVAQTLLNTAMTLNPIGLIVAGVAALIAIMVIAIKKYDEWGAVLMLVLGPLGMIVNMVMSFRRHWDSIKDAFNDGGIVSGLKRIGLTLLDAVLMPLQQLLDLASKLPGQLGKIATLGSKTINALRNKLNLLPDGVVQTSSATTNTAEELADASGITNPSGASSLKLKDGIDTINGGGAKQTNINITFGNLIGEQTISVSGAKESVDEMVEMIEEGVLRVLNSANQIATQS